MVANWASVLAFLHPAIDIGPQRSCRLQDDGDGPFIVQWDEAALGPQPTLKALELVEASPEYQTYFSTREKTAAIEQGKAGITPKDIAIARLAYSAAGKPVPPDADLVVAIRTALEAQK